MRSNTLVNLVCLPFAGAGASVFAEWQQLTNSIIIEPVQLAGREKKFLETAFKDVYSAIPSIERDVVKSVDCTKPIIIFGHSLGAVLAYELVKALSLHPQLNIHSLIVSGSPGPYSPRKVRATGLPDNEFIKQVKSFSGYTHPALEDPMMQELIMPVLRADIQMHEEYMPKDSVKIEVPILAIRGNKDELVSSADAAQWATVTSGGCKFKEIDGGHMYFSEDPSKLIKFIEDYTREENNET